MLGNHNLIIDRIGDQSLEVGESPQILLQEERKQDLNEEEKLMDEICLEQEQSLERHPSHI
jgi:hypothetical protein